MQIAVRKPSFKVKKGKITFTQVISHLFLILGGIVMIYPLIFIFMASFFSAEEFNTSVIGFFPIAKNPTLDNFKAIFTAAVDKNTLTYLKNSLIRTAMSTVFNVLTTLLAGYVFARLKFKGKNVLFAILLATQMMPSIVGTLPMYVELVHFPFTNGKGIYDTFWVYVLLNGPMINIMGTFLVKQSIESIPQDTIDSAKLDGAGTFRIIFKIVFPSIKTILAYIAITTAIGMWNDWSTPFFYTDSDSLQTIASALTKLTAFAGQEGSSINYPAILSFSLMLTIPSLIIFAIFQKWIVEGIANAGIKG